MPARILRQPSTAAAPRFGHRLGQRQITDDRAVGDGAQAQALGRDEARRPGGRHRDRADRAAVQRAVDLVAPRQRALAGGIDLESAQLPLRHPNDIAIVTDARGGVGQFGRYLAHRPFVRIEELLGAEEQPRHRDPGQLDQALVEQLGENGPAAIGADREGAGDGLLDRREIVEDGAVDLRCRIIGVDREQDGAAFVPRLADPLGEIHRALRIGLAGRLGEVGDVPAAVLEHGKNAEAIFGQVLRFLGRDRLGPRRARIVTDDRIDAVRAQERQEGIACGVVQPKADVDGGPAVGPGEIVSVGHREPSSRVARLYGRRAGGRVTAVTLEAGCRRGDRFFHVATVDGARDDGPPPRPIGEHQDRGERGDEALNTAAARRLRLEPQVRLAERPLRRVAATQPGMGRARP